MADPLATYDVNHPAMHAGIAHPNPEHQEQPAFTPFPYMDGYSNAVKARGKIPWPRFNRPGTLRLMGKK